YQQQYTAFPNLNYLTSLFPSLYLDRYVRALLHMQKDDDLNGFKVVLSQPAYFSGLDGLFHAGHISVDDFSNYLAIHFLMDNGAEYGIDIPSADGHTARNSKKMDTEPKFHKYITRRGHGARRLSRRPLNSKGLAANDNDAIRTGCIDTLIDYMPYGPGYTYVKNRADRDDVRQDIQKQTENVIDQFNVMLDTLEWIDEASLARAHAKSTNLVRNYVWPDFFGDFVDFEDIDNYHHRYGNLIEPAGMTLWDALKQLKHGLQATEMFDIVDQPGDRTNFLMSPATVNAWYQPERNSITFPFGILNPPYFNLLYPQSYNYGGQAGVGGHELTHGYDDEGKVIGRTYFRNNNESD
ncbi:hypothetical protein PENTCL1PPCAC_8333, partial [Pristionchus entomophagus]